MIASSLIGFLASVAGMTAPLPHIPAPAIRAADVIAAHDPVPHCGVRHAPGAIIVSTTKLYPYAFRLADRLADAGVIILLPHNDDATTTDLEADMRMALDSLKRRGDVCSSQVGVIVLSGAAGLMPSLLTDTSLAFVVSLRVPPDTVDNVNYQTARTPTLVLRARTVASDTVRSVEWEAGSTDNRNVVLTAHIGDAVTIWPLTAAQLGRFTEPLEPLADKVVQWIQRRVNPSDTPPDQAIHTVANRLPSE